MNQATADPSRRALSVWVTGQRAPSVQLAAGPYLPATIHDTPRIPPAIAAHAIAAYSRPGDTVLDPDCGAGTVLVEALRLDRRAVGITDNSRWRGLARANVTAAQRPHGRPDGIVVNHAPRLLQAVTATIRADLILTCLRPPRTIPPAPPAAEAAERSPHPALNLCRTLLAPGGHLIITARPNRASGAAPDTVGQLLQAGRAAGFLPVERVVALHAELRGSRLIPRTSLTQRRFAARHEETTGHPVALIAHHEVLIFQAPPCTVGSRELNDVQPEPAGGARPSSAKDSRVGDELAVAS